MARHPLDRCGDWRPEGYEVRGRYDRFRVGGNAVPDWSMGDADRVVVDRSAFEAGDYNKVVAHVTSQEAAEAVLRLLSTPARAPG